MTDRALLSRLRGPVLVLLALAWMVPAWALPDDPEARSPRWAAADLACAASDAFLPSCRDKAYTAVELGNSGELLRGYLRRSAAPPAVGRQAPSATPNQDDLTPVIHALREVIAAMGLDSRADILLAFATRPAVGAHHGERPERSRKLAAAFPFDALLGWSTTLSGLYRSTGARFDKVLFNAIDPPRLVAWNVVTAESVPDRATARVPAAGALSAGIETPYLRGNTRAEPDSKLGEAGDKAARKKRTIIYMERGRTTVMTVEDPPPK